jgi:hypothetical protein
MAIAMRSRDVRASCPFLHPLAGTVRAFGRRAGLLCPLLTSAPRSGGLSAPSVPEDTVQISWGKPLSLPRTPAGFTVLILDGYGLCDFLPARPTSAASYPVSVRRVAILLHASFRRSLAVPPLRFARASPPSGCTGDFHPQAAGHAQHTRRRAPACAGTAMQLSEQRARRSAYASFGPQPLTFWNICEIGVFAQASSDSVG